MDATKEAYYRGIAGILGPSYWESAYDHARSRPDIDPGDVYLLALGFVVLFAFMFMKVRPDILLWAKRRQARLRAALDTYSRASSPSFIAIAQGDEAARYLRWTDRLTEAPTWLGPLVWIPLVLTVGLLGFRIGGTFGPLADMTPVRTALTLLMGLGGVGVATLAVWVVEQALLAMWARVSRTSPAAYGREVFVGPLLVRMCVRQTLRKADDTLAARTIRTFSVRPEGLRHSAVYDDPGVLAALTEWMATLMRP